MPPVFLSVDTSCGPRFVPSSVPSLNSSRAPSEQQVGALQETNRTALGQVKALEDIIASGEIKVNEADQLRGLYIIKLKRDICMLETNVNNCLELKKDCIGVKTEAKGDDVRK